MNILITGGTGFIGKEIIKQYEQSTDNLIALVRSPKKLADQIKGLKPSFRKRVNIIKGDLTEAMLGLSSTDYNLALTSDVIIHAGGTMDVLLDEETAKKVYSTSARSLIDLAEAIHKRKSLRQFIHVVGYMSPFNEKNYSNELNIDEVKSMLKGDSAYERNKILADQYIRQKANQIGFPLSVVNPSTLVGGEPTGETTQLNGFGVLVNASRRKLMPITPGGKNHWLPLFSNNTLAKFIVFLSQKEHPKNNTYSMTPDKGESLSMTELNQLIARELRLIKPRISIPAALLTSILKLGVGNLVGVPYESMTFINRRTFDNLETKKIANEMKIETLNVNDFLPFVVADLDHRFTFPSQIELTEFSRHVSGNIVYFKKGGTGIPWVIIHGLFSQASDFEAIATDLHFKTGNPVYVIDLPGLGHSPILREALTFNNYVNSIMNVIRTIDEPVKLIGHSIGANMAAKVAEMNATSIEQLILLQPVTEINDKQSLIKKIMKSYSLQKFILPKLSEKMIKNILIKEGAFVSGEITFNSYSKKMHQSLSSPRMLDTNTRIMALVQKQIPEISWKSLPLKTAILWGEEDKAYTAPKQSLYPIELFSSGHQFPIAIPSQVIMAILKF